MLLIDFMQKWCRWTSAAQPQSPYELENNNPTAFGLEDLTDGKSF